ncbi:hypothetical protein ISF_05461 [Cordyceps fumosorosea ARSEF 2679]|uniref:Family c-likeg-protein-coupled receptor protein n=1 Tax=Cordyceps fumosorosea (strain ARSEF 2679) TaxID=1081104 RepID=A0A167UAG4_CORFA|nr:hypothetical protein ISF_05461 [Cordyceps fumosorosea ARSEF 2679]OAA61382.1 hypothetical protein ISF_05461 [Cordyceps fumosorosea ARSEF 2679]
MNAQLMQHGPPYPPSGAGLGGRPTVAVDVPISSVFIALFLTSAILNMTILQLNIRSGHKFILSGVLFGFSMARILANVMRIVWATKPTNASIAIAAGVLTNAGVVLLFVVNLILVQRLLRAYHPSFGWSRKVGLAFKFLYFAIAAAIIMVIVAVVYSFYTLDPKAKLRIREVQLTGVVFLAVLAFLPIPIGLAAGLIRNKNPDDISLFSKPTYCYHCERQEPAREPIGQGNRQGVATSLRFKLGLVLFTSALLTLGAAFRAGVAFYQRPATNPAWFHSKACYYCFNYIIEIVVVFTYALIRFDRLYHVPNGSSAPGHYTVTDPSFETTSGRPMTVAQQQRAMEREADLQRESDKQAA